MGLALLGGFGDSNTKTVTEASANQTQADMLVVKSPQQLHKEEKERLHVR